MEKGLARVSYDQSTDIMYILFKEGPSHEVVEAGSDVVLELDAKGQIMGLEIWNAKKNGFIDQVAKAII